MRISYGRVRGSGYNARTGNTVSAAKREPSTQKNRLEADNLYLMNTNEHFEHNWTMFSTL